MPFADFTPFFPFNLTKQTRRSCTTPMYRIARLTFQWPEKGLAGGGPRQRALTAPDSGGYDRG